MRSRLTAYGAATESANERRLWPKPTANVGRLVRSHIAHVPQSGRTEAGHFRRCELYVALDWTFRSTLHSLENLVKLDIRLDTMLGSVCTVLFTFLKSKYTHNCFDGEESTVESTVTLEF